MKTTIFNTGEGQISYDSESCYLTLIQDREVSVLIGPNGLIEAGLNLCETSNPYADSDPLVYGHPDGVFDITIGIADRADFEELEESDDTPYILTFTEGARDASILLGPDVVSMLGLAMIQHGHALNCDRDKRRYGGRVTFTAVAA
jgi:hypothetical protein